MLIDGLLNDLRVRKVRSRFLIFWRSLVHLCILSSRSIRSSRSIGELGIVAITVLNEMFFASVMLIFIGHLSVTLHLNILRMRWPLLWLNLSLLTVFISLPRFLAIWRPLTNFLFFSFLLVHLLKGDGRSAFRDLWHLRSTKISRVVIFGYLIVFYIHRVWYFGGSNWVLLLSKLSISSS